MVGRNAQRRGRLSLVIGASIALHAALLAVLALQKPPASRMVAPAPIEVTIAPLYLVEPQARQRRDRDRIRPRAPKPITGPLPVAPLYAAPTPPATPTAGPWRVEEAVGGAAQLSQALRKGGLGCTQADLVGLSPSEREACQARLAAGAKTAAYLGQGLNAAKQKTLDLAAERKAAYLRYRDAPIPPGLSTSNAAGGIAGLGEVPAVSQTPR
ncbi:MAG TPA: hypothetical protein PLV04_14380 [Phenylobacterium sp.]|nr:hypothetical protein [Phenylobacterium sp.]HQP20512.1 hypothetical protein [Phenylobacterium sp.]